MESRPYIYIVVLDLQRAQISTRYREMILADTMSADNEHDSLGGKVLYKCKTAMYN